MSQRVYRFATFTVDTGAHVLLKDEVRLSIQEQPFQVLLALLEDPGQVVTREALRIRLWGTDTFVDFDQSLNSAVRRLRLALEDNSRDPIFIETIPRVGFRFLLPVELEHLAPTPVRTLLADEIDRDGGSAPLPMEMPETPVGSASRRFPAALAGVSTLTFAVGLLLGMLPHWRDARLAERDAARDSVAAIDGADSSGPASLTQVVAANETGSAVSTDGARAERSELQGWYHLRQRTDADYKEAEQAFHQTLVQRPKQASALVGLGETEVLMALNGDAPQERLRRARSVGQEALAVSPHLGSAHTLIGAADALSHWNDAEAEQEFRTALHLQPHDSLSHLWFAVFVLLPRQDYREAEKEAALAIREDPLSLIAHTDLGWILYSEGKHEAALDQYRFVLQLDPHFIPAQFRVQQALRAERREDEFAPSATQRLTSSRVQDAAASQTHGTMGDPADVCAEAAAPALAAERRLPALKAAVQHRCPTTYFFGQDPALSALRKDPAFVALLQVAHPPHGVQ